MIDTNNYIKKYLFNMEVPHFLITEIADTFIGLVTTMTKHYVTSGTQLIFNSSIKENKFVFNNKVYLDEKFAKKNEKKRHKIGDIISVHTGDVGTSAIIDEELDGSIGFATIVTRIKDNSKVYNKYICYFLNSRKVKYQISSLIKGDRDNLNLKDFNKIIVPLPPIEIQKEIVRILDTFTEYQDCLNEELTLRKKQYEYYRDKLLTFNDNVPLKKLGDIAIDIYRGTGIKKDEVTEKGIPCVRYGEIYTKYNIWFDKCFSHTIEENIKNRKYFEYGDVLFAITGESVKEISKSCVYIGNDKCLAGGDIVVLKHNQNPKYMGYVLSTTNAQIQKSKGKVKSKVVHSSVPDISDIIIPVPPLEEQERIVKILDRFDALCNDISSGLPAEIEMRKKQYEYYRDKLLTFEEKKI